MLFNPGPTNVSNGVRNAIKTHDICHRESEFFEVLTKVRKKLLKVVNGEETHSVVAFVSSGTGCNEAIISSIHGKVLLINNGKYAKRLGEITERYNIPLIELKFDPLKPIDLGQIDSKLESNPDITHMVFVHHETTTGMILPLHDLGQLAKKYGVITVADTISSLGGYKIDVVKDNINFCTVSANKCLQSFPGISFVIAKKSDIEKLKGKSRSFYFNLYNQWESAEKSKQLPFTPAVQLFFALDKALDELIKEGVENRIKRQKENAEYMREGLREMGFKFILPDNLQSNILTSIHLPKDMDYWVIHDELKKRGFTIYSGQSTLDKGIFRVATLGNLFKEDIDSFLKNFKEVLCRVGFSPSTSKTVKPKKAIILLAGMGTRLKPVTDDIPKCLVKINGKSILENTLSRLNEFGINEVTLVVGYLANKIQEKIGDSFKRIKIKYIKSNIYDKTNNSYSLWIGIKNLDEDLLILEGDIFFESKLLKSFIDDKHKNKTLVEKWNSKLDGSFVEVDNGIVKAWIHKKDRPEEFKIENKYKTVNIHSFSKEFINTWLKPELKTHIEETGGTEPIETIFKNIVTKGCTISAPETKGKWFEIDDVNDLKMAEEIFEGV